MIGWLSLGSAVISLLPDVAGNSSLSHNYEQLGLKKSPPRDVPASSCQPVLVAVTPVRCHGQIPRVPMPGQWNLDLLQVLMQ